MSSAAAIPTRHVAAWFVVLAGVSAALHVAKLSPAIPALQRDLGIGLVTSGVLLSLVLLAGALLGLVVGLVADRVGLRRSQLAGLAILTVTGLAGGWATDERALLVLRALEGPGFLLSSVPAPGIIRRLVPADRLTRMLGIWSAFIPVGSTLALLVGPAVIVGLGWPAWWWSTAAVSGLIGLLVWRFVPADPPRAPDEGPDAEPWTRRLSGTLRTPGPWLGAGVFAVYGAQWLSVIGFLPSVYAESGWVGTTGAVLSALVAAVNVGGNVVAGVLVHHGVRPRTLLYAGFTAMALGSYLAFGSLTASAPVARYAGALVFSGPGGLVPATLFVLAPRLAPSERTISTTVGWLQQWSGLGQVVGPPAVAWLVTRVGGWQWTWALTGSWCLAGILLAAATAAHLRRRYGPDG